MTSQPPLKEFATVEELGDAVNRLSPEDRRRLYKSGNVLALGSEFADGKDLLNEAVKRSFIGTSGEGVCGERGRPWPKGVDLRAFLIQCMRSIANGSQNSIQQKVDRKAKALATDDTESDHAVDGADTSHPGVDEELIDLEDGTARQAAAEAEVAAIRGLFKKGDLVHDILDGESEGMTVAEVLEVSGATQTEYDSARRRLRRTIDKFMPGRRQK